jgi:hypothetical protein|tara:strand:- start:333 stop:827 length:495 start_codon:yes stop_codon:yes gene_type:complete
MATLKRISFLLLALCLFSKLTFAAEALVTIKTDDFTDKVSATLLISPDQVTGTTDGSIFISCTKTSYKMVFPTGFTLNDGSRLIDVKIRFDKNPVLREEMVFVNNKLAMTETPEFIGEVWGGLFESESLVIQVGRALPSKFSFDADDKEKMLEYLTFSMQGCKP